MTRVAIVGYAVNGFDGQTYQSPEELISSVSIDLMNDLGITRADIDSTMLSDQDAFDGTAISSGIKVTPAGGYKKPTMRVQNCCGYGIHQAIAKIKADKADLIAVVGADTIEADPVGVSHISSEAFYERDIGQNHLMSFGLLSNYHLGETDVTEEDLAAIAARNYERAAQNPHAHRNGAPSQEDVLASDRVVEPLRELMVSPMSFGAAIMYVASEEKVSELDVDPVWLTGSGAASSRYDFRSMDDLLEQPSLETARETAYDEAGIDDAAAEVDVVETYSPTPTHELLTLQSLELARKADAVDLAREERTADGRDIALHPSGGAMATNPPNTGGIFRAIAATQALTGELDPGVDDPERAVVHDSDLFLGDQGVTDAVLVLEREVAV